ncbi:pro-resilin-like [Colias croceus]|uniref:pro-resilin-like n=1 Tax=Colias crocea TaxID=72248 RepID=UPI001E27A7BB|nr:pro-resilin-like [Colias croceus]
MKLFIIFVAFAIASAYGKPQYDGYPVNGAASDNNYLYKYMVKQEPVGPNFGQRESRIGNRVVGMYYVLLPDGRIQKVDYVADENGYRPTVSYLLPN